MPIKYKYNAAVPTSYDVHIDVSVVQPAGRVVLIKAGTFTVGGVLHSLSEDWEWELPLNRGHSLTVLGFLVKEKDTGDIQVLIDEFWNDGSDELYQFTMDCPFEPLVELFEFTVKPEDGNSLDDVEITVRHSQAYVPPTPPEPDTPPLTFPEEG